ncbi:MAG: pitrilysin family protein [Bacteroidota bacterium]
MEYIEHSFPSGLRLIYKYAPSPVAHAGVTIAAGSRHEEAHEQGLAHFLEHCLFKGTHKRNATQILKRMEEVGGEINAFTAREETSVHATFLARHYTRAIELFADILFNSTFPAKELENEKKVILEEIKSVKDNPYEYVLDHFDSLVFSNHPLGQSILGNPKSLKSFTAAHLQEFLRKHYRPENIVLSFVGNIDMKVLVRKIEQHFPCQASGKSTERSASPFRIFKPEDYKPFDTRISKRTFQTHCVLGNLAYHLEDEKRVPFALLNNMLGGPAMSSLLNLHLREKRGRAYTVESHFSPFTETGVFLIYLGTDFMQLKDSLQLIEKILKGLRENDLSETSLRKAKEQYLGQIAISFDSNFNQMISMGKSLQVYGSVDTFEEIENKINAVTAESVRLVAAEVLNPEKMSTLAYLSAK